jgi:hypothetical protein
MCTDIPGSLQDFLFVIVCVYFPNKIYCTVYWHHHHDHQHHHHLNIPKLYMAVQAVITLHYIII